MKHTFWLFTFTVRTLPELYLIYTVFDICWLPVECHIQNGTLCYKSESTKFCTVCKSLGKKEPKWRFPLVKYLYDVFENFRTFYVYKTTNMCIIIFYYC